MALLNGTKVRLHSTSVAELDGLVCTVAGIGDKLVWDRHTVYILKLPEGFKSAVYPYECMCLTEHCMTVIE